jgi:hypothetical protein
MIRLDGIDPADPTAIVASPVSIGSAHLAQLLRNALSSTSFTTPPHPANPAGWEIAWGVQLEPRQVKLTVRDVDDAGHITTGAVAGYLAKYATKATEITGHASARLTDETITLHADRSTHPGRLIAACWRLGQAPMDVLIAHRELERRHAPDEDGDPLAEWMAGYGRLRRWAHMLGFGGHFSTKSRRYSTTLGALREARRAWRRAHLDEQRPTDEHADDDPDGDDTTVVIGALAFAGIGWHTSADALLANTAAANARAKRLIAREELATT